MNGLSNAGGSSGGITETVLWENPSPTASTFAYQTISLSESIDDFDYIKIVWKEAPLSTTTHDFICKSSEVTSYKTWAGGGNNQYTLFGYVWDYVNYYYYRDFTRGSTAKNIIFWDAIRNSSSTSHNTSNGYVIPVEIIGLKGKIGGDS